LSPPLIPRVAWLAWPQTHQTTCSRPPCIPVLGFTSPHGRFFPPTCANSATLVARSHGIVTVGGVGVVGPFRSVCHIPGMTPLSSSETLSHRERSCGTIAGEWPVSHRCVCVPALQCSQNARCEVPPRIECQVQTTPCNRHEHWKEGAVDRKYRRNTQTPPWLCHPCYRPFLVSHGGDLATDTPNDLVSATVHPDLRVHKPTRIGLSHKKE
jgi:hypothetical protein